MSKPNFKRDLEAGKRGELAVQELWPELELLHGKGADAKLPNGELVELKMDRYAHHKTENFFMEYLGDVAAVKLGGPWKAETDGCEWFVYYFQDPGIAYVFNTHDLLYEIQTYILANNPPLVEVKNSRWLTVGYKIPRSALSPSFVLQKPAK